MVERGVLTQVERSFRLNICPATSALHLIVDAPALAKVQLVLTQLVIIAANSARL